MRFHAHFIDCAGKLLDHSVEDTSDFIPRIARTFLQFARSHGQVRAVICQTESSCIEVMWNPVAATPDALATIFVNGQPVCVSAFLESNGNDEAGRCLKAFRALAVKTFHRAQPVAFRSSRRPAVLSMFCVHANADHIVLTEDDRRVVREVTLYLAAGTFAAFTTCN